MTPVVTSKRDHVPQPPSPPAQFLHTLSAPLAVGMHEMPAPVLPVGVLLPKQFGGEVNGEAVIVSCQ